MPEHALLLIVGAAVAGFVQGLSGFAFGMVSMSFWAWTIDPRAAAVLTVFGSLVGQLVAAFSAPRAPRWALLLPFVVGGLVGVPVGTAVLPHLEPERFKAFFGAMLVIFCPLMLVAQDLPRFTRGGRVADAAVGLAGGVLGGLGGFTGVLPTLWCTLRGLDKDVQRGLIQNFNLAMLSVAMASYLAAGVVTAAMLPQLALVAPALLIPSLLGARVYIGLSPLAFRRVVLGVLTASGAAMLVSSLPRLLA